MSEEVQFDWRREARTAIPEVIYAAGKSTGQLLDIANAALTRNQSILMTRVSAEQAASLVDSYDDRISFHELARTVVVSPKPGVSPSVAHPCVAIVAAGTSDLPLVAEIEQCLQFLQVPSRRYVDVGVAGLWRLTSIAEELNTYPLLIAVAGMEGAIFSVLAGLVQVPVIAVPSPVGYGVSAGGFAALNSALGSCSPGIAVVNIDNGFGAAALTLKMLNMSSGMMQDRHESSLDAASSTAS